MVAEDNKAVFRRLAEGVVGPGRLEQTKERWLRSSVRRLTLRRPVAMSSGSRLATTTRH